MTFKNVLLVLFGVLFVGLSALSIDLVGQVADQSELLAAAQDEYDESLARITETYEGSIVDAQAAVDEAVLERAEVQEQLDLVTEQRDGLLDENKELRGDVKNLKAELEDYDVSTLPVLPGAEYEEGFYDGQVVDCLEAVTILGSWSADQAFPYCHSLHEWSVENDYANTNDTLSAYLEYVEALQENPTP